jgi:hypothetical protein
MNLTFAIHQRVDDVRFSAMSVCFPHDFPKGAFEGHRKRKRVSAREKWGLGLAGYLLGRSAHYRIVIQKNVASVNDVCNDSFIYFTCCLWWRLVWIEKVVAAG